MQLNQLTSKQHVIRTDDLLQSMEPAPKSGYNGTKIVFTIGPATHEVDTLCEILQNGAACARVDLTWGTTEYHLRSLKHLEEACKRTGITCPIMVDTQGRELFIRRPFTVDANGWPKHDEPVQVQEKQQIVITSDPNATFSSSVFPIQYDGLHQMVTKGDILYVGRYLENGAEAASLYLQVTEVKGNDVVCEASNECELDGLLTLFHVERSMDMTQCLNAQNSSPLFSKEDMESLKKFVDAGINMDFLSLSYTRSREDIMEATKVLQQLGIPQTRIVAKIESRYALLRFKSILQYTDILMISRGNLGLDIAPEKMALVQRNIILQCNILGKTCIVTRVVDTMTINPRPTRAEATDVANLVLEGADAMLLGAQTVRGLHPLTSVSTVKATIMAAQQVFDHQQHFDHIMREAVKLQQSVGVVKAFDERTKSQQALTNLDEVESRTKPENIPPALQIQTMTNIHGMRGIGGEHEARSSLTPSLGSTYLSKAESIASSAVRAADKCEAKLIIIMTETGRTAQLVAKYRPIAPVYALVVPHITSDGIGWKLEGMSVARRMALIYGVTPVTVPERDLNPIESAITRARFQGHIDTNDFVVVVERLREDFVLKVVCVDEVKSGSTLKKISSRVQVPLRPAQEATYHTTPAQNTTPVPAAPLRALSQVIENVPSACKNVLSPPSSDLWTPTALRTITPTGDCEAADQLAAATDAQRISQEQQLESAMELDIVGFEGVGRAIYGDIADASQSDRETSVSVTSFVTSRTCDTGSHYVTTQIMSEPRAGTSSPVDYTAGQGAAGRHEQGSQAHSSGTQPNTPSTQREGSVGQSSPTTAATSPLAFREAIPDTNTLDTNTLETKTSDTNTLDTNTLEKITPDTNTVNTNSLETKTPDTDTFDTNTLDSSTRDTNTLDTNTLDTNTITRQPTSHAPTPFKTSTGVADQRVSHTASSKASSVDTSDVTYGDAQGGVGDSSAALRASDGEPVKQKQPSAGSGSKSHRVSKFFQRFSKK